MISLAERPPRRIPISNAIKLYFHCHKCIKEIPPDESPRSSAALEVGWTKLGLQVWCKRHNCNVVHIDFEGCQHPANLHAKK